MNGLRDLPEKNALRLTAGAHLSQFIPIVLEEKRGSVQKETRGRPVSIIFDGTTRLGEAIAVVLRFVDDEWRIHQRLVRLRTVAKAVYAPVFA